MIFFEIFGSSYSIDALTEKLKLKHFLKGMFFYFQKYQKSKKLTKVLRFMRTFMRVKNISTKNTN
jgi:hypothetical protein